MINTGIDISKALNNEEITIEILTRVISASPFVFSLIEFFTAALNLSSVNQMPESKRNKEMKKADGISKLKYCVPM